MHYCALPTEFRHGMFIPLKMGKGSLDHGVLREDSHLWIFLPLNFLLLLLLLLLSLLDLFDSVCMSVLFACTCVHQCMPKSNHVGAGN